MEYRKYYREELDTTDEICDELQRLRDEVRNEIIQVAKRVAALEKAPEKKKGKRP